MSPTSTRKFAAYVVGLLNIVAWWINAASGTIYVAISAFGIAELWYPDLEGKHWQIYLCYLLVIGLTCKSGRIFIDYDCIGEKINTSPQ